MRITTRVHPNSKKFRTESKGDILHIWCTQPAEKNKANLEIVKELSKRFGSCKIVSGARSSKKVIDVPVRRSLKTLETH